MLWLSMSCSVPVKSDVAPADPPAPTTDPVVPDPPALDSATADSGTRTPTGDTGGPALSPLAGTWAGPCVDPDGLQSIEFDLSLVEVAGAVSGRGTLTVGQVYGGGSYTFVVDVLAQGTWDGTSWMEVELGQDYGGVAQPIDLQLAGEVAGTTWLAEFGSTIYPYPPFPCTLEQTPVSP